MAILLLAAQAARRPIQKLLLAAGVRMRAQNKKLQVKLVKGAQSLASSGYSCTRSFWLILAEERAQ